MFYDLRHTFLLLFNFPTKETRQHRQSNRYTGINSITHFKYCCISFSSAIISALSLLYLYGDENDGEFGGLPKFPLTFCIDVLLPRTFCQDTLLPKLLFMLNRCGDNWLTVQHEDVKLRFESFIDECQLNDVTFTAFASFLGVGPVGDVVMKDESVDDRKKITKFNEPNWTMKILPPSLNCSNSRCWTVPRSGWTVNSK